MTFFSTSMTVIGQRRRIFLLRCSLKVYTQITIFAVIKCTRRCNEKSLYTTTGPAH